MNVNGKMLVILYLVFPSMDAIILKLTVMITTNVLSILVMEKALNTGLVNTKR
jgi:hypothetical protein